MRTYSVFEPEVPPGTLEEDAQALVFVRHGWSLAALFFPMIWMVVRRLWWVLVLYVLAMIALQILSNAVPTLVTVAISVALALIIMIEAGQLRLESMAAKGYREIAVLQAKNQRDAERIFFNTWLEERAVAPVSQPVRGPVLRPGSATPPSLPGFSS